MALLKDVEHRIVYKDQFAYCAHPFIQALANGDWLVVFNQTRRRPFILHPPEDPLYYNVIARSSDRGASWSAPQVAPSYDWHGVECAGLTSLADGTVLLNQWRFRWFPLDMARKSSFSRTLSFPSEWVKELVVSGELTTGYVLSGSPDELIPWARGNGGTFVHRSRDMGRTWDETVQIDTAPYSGGYGMRGALELAGGDVLLPLSDVPNYQTVFVARSSDGGRSWGNLVEAAHLPGHDFEEPSGIRLPDGRLRLLLRDNQTHSLYQCSSGDGGWTWSAPSPTNIRGYPGHVVLLSGGRLLCVYGVRHAPYGIQAVLSDDQGDTWDVEHPLILRQDLANADLGYPSAVVDRDRITVVYYAQDTDGVTCIQSTAFSL